MLLLLVQVERLLDLVADALALGRLCVAVAAMLLLVNITSSAAL